MPPVSPQSSRAGLITALVVFVILFVTSAVLAIYNMAEAGKLQTEVARNKSENAQYVTDPAKTNEQVTAAVAAGRESGKSAIEAVIDERDVAVKQILGTNGNVKQATAQAQAALKSLRDRQKVVSVADGSGLAPTVAMLANTLAAQVQEKNNLSAQLAAAQKSVDDTVAGQKGLNDALTKQVEELRTKYTAAMTELQQYRTGVDTNVAGIETNAKGEIAKAQAAQAQLTQQVAQLQADLKKRTDEIGSLQRKLSLFRVNTKEPIVQVADGKINRLPGSGLAYIDIGAGDQVVVGMTFEVYDKYTGIPALGQDGLRESDMPVGKASIEVMRISAGSSECRIIRQTPGQQLVEGDFVANLVLDPKTKYNFVVYGNFDLDHNGIASPGDTEIVKQLVTRWGGKIQQTIDADTDFVVMGLEPKLPELNDEQKQDPVANQQLEQKTAELNAYQDLIQKANQFSIPVMNQNRFLYYIGYYSQSPR